jgi:hypothetical protein
LISKDIPKSLSRRQLPERPQPAYLPVADRLCPAANIHTQEPTMANTTETAKPDYIGTLPQPEAERLLEMVADAAHFQTRESKRTGRQYGYARTEFAGLIGDQHITVQVHVWAREPKLDKDTETINGAFALLEQRTADPSASAYLATMRTAPREAQLALAKAFLKGAKRS